MSSSRTSDQPIEAELYSGLASALRDRGGTVTRPRGAFLFRQGEQPRGVFVVRKGKVRLLLCCRDSHLFAHRTVGPGHILGLPATVSDRPYSLAAQAIENCELAMVDRTHVMDLLHSRIDLALQVVSILADEVRGMRKEAGALATLAPLH